MSRRFDLVQVREPMLSDTVLNSETCNLDNVFMYVLLFSVVFYLLFTLYEYFSNYEDEVDELENENNDPQNNNQQQIKDKQLLDKYNELLELQKQVNELLNKKQ